MGKSGGEGVRLVAFETSTPCLGIALWAAGEEKGRSRGSVKGRVVAEVHINDGLRHAETLLPNLRWLLRQVGWTLQDLHGVAVSVGPGSFTGVRLGVAAARALGQALSCPLVGVTTLEALAMEGLEWTMRTSLAGPTLVVPMVPTLRDEVFTAIYAGAAGGIVPLTSPQTSHIASWLAHLRRWRIPDNAVPAVAPGVPPASRRSPRPRWVFAGPGAVLHREVIERWAGPARVANGRTLLVPQTASGPQVMTIARLGAQAFSIGKGRRFDRVRPLYGRPSLAEERFRGQSSSPFPSS